MAADAGLRVDVALVGSSCGLRRGWLLGKSMTLHAFGPRAARASSCEMRGSIVIYVLEHSKSGTFSKGKLKDLHVFK